MTNSSEIACIRHNYSVVILANEFHQVLSIRQMGGMCYSWVIVRHTPKYCHVIGSARLICLCNRVILPRVGDIVTNALRPAMFIPNPLVEHSSGPPCLLTRKLYLHHVHWLLTFPLLGQLVVICYWCESTQIGGHVNMYNIVVVCGFKYEIINAALCAR